MREIIEWSCWCLRQKENEEVTQAGGELDHLFSRMFSGMTKQEVTSLGNCSALALVHSALIQDQGAALILVVL